VWWGRLLGNEGQFEKDYRFFTGHREKPPGVTQSKWLVAFSFLLCCGGLMGLNNPNFWIMMTENGGHKLHFLFFFYFSLIALPQAKFDLYFHWFATTQFYLLILSV
jgi:hypothetical protein